MTLSVGTVQNNNNAYDKKLESKAILAGAAASSICGIIGSLPSQAILENMQKMNGELSTSQISDIRNALSKGLEQSELLKKGVKFIEIAVQEPKTLKEKMLAGNPLFATLFGKNACFVQKLPKTLKIKYIEDGVEKVAEKNMILAPQNKMVYSWFHEMGHALNFNNGGYAKFLQKLRVPAQVAAVVIPVVALLSKKRNENGEKPLSAYDKTINFIRNNAGKLTFLCFVPALIEEGLATAKGQKWAEKLLSSDVTKNMLKHNKLAFLTYVLCAVTSGYAAYAGVKAKDKYIETKKKQLQNKMAA